MVASPRRFQLIPSSDERQALRVRRYLMAAGTSLMVIALLYVAYLLGGLDFDGLVSGAALTPVSAWPPPNASSRRTAAPSPSSARPVEGRT